jgi:hypothetical protein
MASNVRVGGYDCGYGCEFSGAGLRLYYPFRTVGGMDRRLDFAH